ncbi:MAG: heat-inducible transcriptional repressor HrcA [Syntrophobacteraceae bacterium]
MIELADRDQKVLEAIVIDYIESGEPVGSRTIAKRYGLNVSSATIRNIMCDLEDLGLLLQPHASAGRAPTEKGLRLYIDYLMRSKRLAEEEKALILQAYRDGKKDIQELLRRSSAILSRFCKQAGVVLWPKLRLMRFRHIELIKVRQGQALAVLVSESGLVHQMMLDVDEDITQDDLDKYSRYINELLLNVPLGEVKERILSEMQKEKVLFDQLYVRALDISRRFFQSGLNDAEVYIEGRTNLLNSPEFADVDRMRRILEAFEDKARIVKLLDMALRPSESVASTIILGPESELDELQEISLISSPYRHGETAVGVLGVIGPMRMDYSRIIPIVEFTADLLSQLLDEPDQI